MGDDGRKKRQFFASRNHGNGKRRRVFELRDNSCGILFTVGSPMRMREGMHELMALLDDICAIPAAEENKANPSGEDNVTTDVTKALAKELQELKQEKARFTPYMDITKGVGYCQFVTRDKTPNDLTYNILRRLEAARDSAAGTKGDSEKKISTESVEATAPAPKLKKSKTLCCRFLNRLIPVDAACAPHPPNLYRVAQTLIASYFPESEVARDPEQFANDLIRLPSSAEQGETDQVVPAEDVTTQHATPDAESSQHASDPSVHSEGVPETDRTQPGHQKSVHTNEEHTSDGVQARKTNTASATFVFSAPFQVPKGATWCLKFQRRGGMTTIDRDELISKVGAYVGPNYTVNLSSPDFTILVENLPAFCGISVVRDYVTLCYYNAHRLCFPENYAHDAKNAQTEKTETSTPTAAQELPAESATPNA